MGRSSQGRNDPCWCESGVKFKKCHGGPNPPRTPPDVISDRILRKGFSLGRCLYPGADECPEPIRSHTIQRSGPLRRLLDKENRVAQLYLNVTTEPSPIWQLKKVGWRNASTFPGFCANHDSTVFRPLEDEAFSARPDQCFLVGFRAICHELQRKTALQRTRRQLEALVKFNRGAIPAEMKQFDEDAELARKELAKKKRRLDAILLRRTWTDWESRVLHFSGSLEIVGAGSMTPEFDLDGERIQSAADFSKALENLTVGVVEIGEDFAFVFGWERVHEAPQKAVDSLLRQGTARIPHLLVQFLFLHLENIFFRSEWWEALPRAGKSLLTHHLGTVDELRVPRFSSANLVDWELRNVLER